jgi:hypothetical protein
MFSPFKIYFLQHSSHNFAIFTSFKSPPQRGHSLRKTFSLSLGGGKKKEGYEEKEVERSTTGIWCLFETCVITVKIITQINLLNK